MRHILILKLGSTFPDLARTHGDFENWIQARLGLPMERVGVLDARLEELLPDPGAFAGIVLTGSHSMVTDREAWSERVASWLPKVIEAHVPLLGICYGHQLLARAMGGEAGPNPRGPEFGTVDIELTGSACTDPLFADLPPRFRAQACHQQSVLRLPPGATLLASSDGDPHQAFALGRLAWGVQFHPEFDPVATRAYIHDCAKELRARGIDPTSRQRAVTRTVYAESLLKRFGEIIHRRDEGMSQILEFRLCARSS